MAERDGPAADVAIVGAGAAGLATALFLTRDCPGASVVALDGAPRIGAKILVSGGGRCNVTNVRVRAEDFYGGNPHVLRRVLAAFSAQQTRAFFEQIGVPLHEEEYGKLFPDSNSARAVLAALLREAARHGACVLARHRVTAAEPAADRFHLAVRVGPANEAQSQTWTARYVVLATGGLSLPRTGSDGLGYQLARRLGHSLVPTTPALDPLVLDGDLHRPLAGIAHDVELLVQVAGCKPRRIRGPLLWTHFGVSGPAAMNASRFWNRARVEGRSASIAANLLAGLDFQAAERAWLDFASTQPRTHQSTALRRWLPARVADAVLIRAGADPAQSVAQIPRAQRRRLLHRLLAWPLPVVATRGYRYAEVTAGGVPLDEIDPSTLESRCCPGLYLAGEILDVDGPIGGFNFQWAWSSAWVAAAALARRLSGRPTGAVPRGRAGA